MEQGLKAFELLRSYVTVFPTKMEGVSTLHHLTPHFTSHRDDPNTLRRFGTHEHLLCMLNGFVTRLS